MSNHQGISCASCETNEINTIVIWKIHHNAEEDFTNSPQAKAAFKAPNVNNFNNDSLFFFSQSVRSTAVLFFLFFLPVDNELVNFEVCLIKTYLATPMIRITAGRQ